MRARVSSVRLRPLAPPHQSDRPLALPHLAVPDVSWVDWAALRAAGFEGCVFDKDNTVTAPNSLEVFPSLAVCTLLQRYT